MKESKIYLIYLIGKNMSLYCTKVYSTVQRTSDLLFHRDVYKSKSENKY